MVEAVNIPVAGGVPPLPPGGTEGRGVGNHAPAPATPPVNTPAPAPTGATYTEADVQARIAAALASQAAPTPPAQSNPAAAITAPAPSAAITSATGDTVLDSLTNLFTSSAQGIDIDRAIGKALEYGDPKLIDEAYIREKGGAQAAHLANLAKGIVDRVQSQTQAAAQAVYAAAGGEANWNAAAAAFNANAPAHLRQVVGTMLKSNGIEQAQAAAKMIMEFAQGSGLVPKQGSYVQGNPGVAADTQPLDKLGFQQARQALIAKRNTMNDRAFNGEMDVLFARRQAGKNRGIN